MCRAVYCVLVALVVCLLRADGRVLVRGSSSGPEEGDLFEGDIIVPDETRNEVIESVELWPNRVFWYEYGNDFTAQQQQVIEDAILDLRLGTCVAFKRWRPSMVDQTHVRFRNVGTACASLVGYQPRLRQIDLFLAFPGCSSHGTIQHEILHSLGFWHEHTRADRDLFVDIAWNNITPGLESNFKARAGPEDVTAGLPYDYHSVMHYRALAFSKDTHSYTILPRDPTAFFAIGQRKRFSPLDLAKLNAMYNCSTALKTHPTAL